DDEVETYPAQVVDKRDSVPSERHGAARLPRPLSPHRRGREPASYQYRSEQARARKRLHQPGYATGVRRLQKTAPPDGGYAHRAAGSVLAARRSARSRWTNDHRTVGDAADQDQRPESHGPDEGHHPAQDALVGARPRSKRVSE